MLSLWRLELRKFAALETIFLESQNLCSQQKRKSNRTCTHSSILKTSRFCMHWKTFSSLLLYSACTSLTPHMHVAGTLQLNSMEVKCSTVFNCDSHRMFRKRDFSLSNLNDDAFATQHKHESWWSRSWRNFQPFFFNLKFFLSELN